MSCPEYGRDILFKIVTIINIAKKVGLLLGNKEIKFTKWPFGDCLVEVKFFDISYAYCCPRGFDFNIFMNPFFHECEITAFVYNNLQKGDTFIDVGAHGGLYTIIAGKKAGSAGKVMSIEPNPENLKYLRINVELNKLKNVRVFPKAAAERETQIELFYEPEETACTTTSRTTKRSRRIEVQTTTLDNIGEPCDSIKIIKIDTEGYDMNVLRGGECILRRTKYVLTEQTTRNVRDFLVSLGYGIQLLKPSGYLLATNIAAKRAAFER